MIKSHPKQLAIDISERSNCRVKVGAVLVDRKGIFSWGWCGMGYDGLGMCAEHHAILRANPKRLKGATVYVFGTHRKTSNPIPARPCRECSERLKRVGIKKVVWNNKSDGWETYAVQRQER